MAADDLIFALASGAGRAAVSIVRLSGSRAGAALGRLCGGLPEPRRALLRALRAPDGEVLDRALVLWFPAPASYTGEDSAELHLHGGHAVREGVASALVALGARPAEPGEFSRRAFLNGRMDLVEAEAVADLVEAETSAQRRQALRQLDGELGALYRGWTERLTRLLAQQEALIDFPEDDLPADVERAMLAEIEALRAAMAAHLDDGRRGERLREGLVFAVSGAPNVGKSSLINALAQREVAIVSPMAGTTRDVLEARVVLGGVPVTLLDTAGLRDTEDPVEAEGVRRARARAEAADLVLLVVDDRGPHAPAPSGRVVVVANKADLGGARPDADLAVSALTGAGLDALRARLAREAETVTHGAGSPALTRARHRAAIGEASGRLGDALDATLAELRGEALRDGLRSLGRITGRVGVEAILNAVFSQFCIGK